MQHIIFYLVFTLKIQFIEIKNKRSSSIFLTRHAHFPVLCIYELFKKIG